VGLYPEHTISNHTTAHKRFKNVRAHLTFDEHPLLNALSVDALTSLIICQNSGISHCFQHLLSHQQFSYQMADLLQTIRLSGNNTLILESFFFVLPKVKTFAAQATISKEGTLSITTRQRAVIQGTSSDINALAHILQHTCLAWNNSPLFQTLACSLYAAFPDQFTHISGPQPCVEKKPRITTASDLIMWLDTHPIKHIASFQIDDLDCQSSPLQQAQKIMSFANACTTLKIRALEPSIVNVHHTALFQHYFEGCHPKDLILKARSFHRYNYHLSKVINDLKATQNFALFFELIIFLRPKSTKISEQVWFSTVLIIPPGETQPQKKERIHLIINGTPAYITPDSWLDHFCSFALNFYDITINSLLFRDIITSFLLLMPEDVHPHGVTEGLSHKKRRTLTLKDLMLFLTCDSQMAHIMRKKQIPLLIYDHLDEANALTCVTGKIRELYHMYPNMPEPSDLTLHASQHITQSLLLSCQRAHTTTEDFRTIVNVILHQNHPAWRICTLQYLCPRAQSDCHIQWIYKAAIITEGQGLRLICKADSPAYQILLYLHQHHYGQNDFGQMARALCFFLPEGVEGHGASVIHFMDQPLSNGGLFAALGKALNHISQQLPLPKNTTEDHNNTTLDAEVEDYTRSPIESSDSESDSESGEECPTPQLDQTVGDISDEDLIIICGRLPDQHAWLSMAPAELPMPPEDPTHPPAFQPIKIKRALPSLNTLYRDATACHAFAPLSRPNQ